MNKILKLTIAGLGGAVAIVGAGLVGGLYNQYKNYQTLSALADNSKSIWKSDEAAYDAVAGSSSSQYPGYAPGYGYVNGISSILPSWWNKNAPSSITTTSNLIANWNKVAPLGNDTAYTYNSILFNPYANDYSSYKNYILSAYSSDSSGSGTSSTTTQPSEQQIKDMYTLVSGLSNLDFRYSADQGGVIAGSVLLAVGLVVFIVFLVLALKKSKVTEVKPEEPQPTE